MALQLWPAASCMYRLHADGDGCVLHIPSVGFLFADPMPKGTCQERTVYGMRSHGSVRVGGLMVEEVCWALSPQTALLTSCGDSAGEPETRSAPRG